MKKIFNRCVVVLAIIMCCSVLLGIACKLDWKTAIANTNYTEYYSQLTYQELDDRTYRSSPSSLPAQITVFTHGLGGTPSHWSNQGHPVVEGSAEYEFEYDEASMPEQFKRRLEDNGQQVAMFTATVAIKNSLVRDNEKTIDEKKIYYKTNFLEGEWESRGVSDGLQGGIEEKDGADSHRALYKQFYNNGFFQDDTILSKSEEEILEAEETGETLYQKPIVLNRQEEGNYNTLKEKAIYRECKIKCVS